MVATFVKISDLMAAAEQAGIRVESAEETVNRRKIRFTVRPNGDRYFRRSNSGRRVNSVCSHGYRAFFHALFERCPEATVTSEWFGRRTVTKGNLEEVAGQLDLENVGSRMQPLLYRDACDCGR